MNITEKSAVPDQTPPFKAVSELELHCFQCRINGIAVVNMFGSERLNIADMFFFQYSQ